MKTKIISSIAVLAVTPFSIVEGRSWLDLDIPAIESIRNDDPLYSPGSTLLIEDTSLYGSFKLVASEDRSIDVSTPSTTPNNSSSDDEIQLVGDAPLSLSDQPTFSPSKHYEALNGSCPSNHNLFRLWLYDSVGDGWGSTKLTIKDSVEDTTIFMGTLHVNYGVVKYDTDASLASTHNKNSRRDRQLDMTLGGTISGPSGSITWDANGNVVYGVRQSQEKYVFETEVDVQFRFADGRPWCRLCRRQLCRSDRGRFSGRPDERTGFGLFGLGGHAQI